MVYKPHKKTKFTGLIGWIDERLPLFTILDKHIINYLAPRNLSYLWNFGSLAGVTLVIMIFTGIFLALHYVADTQKAFASVEYIMRQVNYGWLIRYLHMNGASMFFIIVYIHLLRGLYYGSYKPPRELLWILGVVILLLMMATAFMGYVLPWGQMSFWAATVITNLFSAIPLIGDKIVVWLWGDFAVGDPTLTRFYAFHFVLPFVIVAVVFLHLVALHRCKSNNPLGVEAKNKEDMITFHPYYTAKDNLGLGVFLTIYLLIVFFAPNLFSEPDNYIPADPLVTPEHIVPEWYFLPYYAMLRAVPDKLLGVVLMFSSIFVLFFLPWLDRHPVRSARFRPNFRIFYIIFVVNIFVLGWAGKHPPESYYLIIARIATIYYFAYFLIIIPLLNRYEKIGNVPYSIKNYEERKKSD